MYFVDDYDIAVIGAGHAGIEAALAAARLGQRVAVFTINLDAVGNMPCNPCIGGTAKGQLVSEIDALGGEMAKAADSTFLQSRMLNTGKGPAVQSLRVQSDRRQYSAYMKNALESCEGVALIQAEIVDILMENGAISGVVTHLGAQYGAKAVIIASGTYLKGQIIVGESCIDSGPDGMFASTRLSARLREMGVPLRRFKTGTPARVNRRTVDVSGLERQDGDEHIIPFSYENQDIGENKVCCYLTHTTEATHKIIRDNIGLSPLYSGMIKGIGPRYCPSIEDKVMRFADKKEHQLFLEPCGLNTQEIYIQGLSSSLPEKVQREFIKTIPGLENAQIMRVAYAIEYDCTDSTVLHPTLEFKNIPGLYGAGQFNGSSGYEEAAAQGLVAGINAARKIQKKPPFILDRASSYIGTLIDDLVTKGTNEPYRMMTSRSEYRLLLRQDNADLRLTPLGYELGLISQSRYDAFLKKKNDIDTEIKRLKKTIVSPSNPLVNEILTECGTSPVASGVSLYDIISRPQVSYSDTERLDENRPALCYAVRREVEIMIKYNGYIQKQTAAAAQFYKLENKKLPDDINYTDIKGLRLEAAEKLNQRRPPSVGAASRISGVSPADVSVLLIYLEKRKRDADNRA